MPSNRTKQRRRKKRQRSVYVIARPLRAAGPLAPFSDGKFPICHWGLLVTNCSRDEVASQWTRYRETGKSSLLPPLGTMIELRRHPDNTNTYNLNTDFGLCDWYEEWGFNISITYVGVTRRSDSSLAYQGRFYHYWCCSSSTSASDIVRPRPDYNAYTNNCQNFVLYLLEFACPQSLILPKTFKDAVVGLLLEWNPSQMQTRSFTLRSPGNSLNANYAHLKEPGLPTAMSALWKLKQPDLNVIIVASVVLF